MSKEKNGVSPSDAAQSARTTANKVRNIKRAKVHKEVVTLRILKRQLAGKPVRGTARAVRRAT